jgi:hypothetical protein
MSMYWEPKERRSYVKVGYRGTNAAGIDGAAAARINGFCQTE